MVVRGVWMLVEVVLDLFFFRTFGKNRQMAKFSI
jgi:hypothetical protein